MKRYVGRVLIGILFVCFCISHTHAFLFKNPSASGAAYLSAVERNNATAQAASRVKRGSSSTPFTRTDGMECVLKYVDGLVKYKDVLGHELFKFQNKDGCVDVKEIQNAKERYLKDHERLATAIVKDNDQIMWDCDYDTTARSMKDLVRLRTGCITREDMRMSVDHCITSQTDLTLLKEKVCDRAKTMNPQP